MPFLPIHNPELEHSASKIYKTSALNNSPLEIIKSIERIFIDGNDENWILKQSFVDGLNGSLLLENKNNDSQIFIKTNYTPLNIEFGYSPNGGILQINESISDPDPSEIVGFSGMRRITGCAANNTEIDLLSNSGMGKVVWIASYFDTMTIFIETSSNPSYFKYGVHIGKIYSPDNSTDDGTFVDGSGIMIGIPSNVGAGTAQTTGNWLSYSNTFGLGSCIRIGENSWSNLTIINITTNQENDLNNQYIRLVPYSVGGSIVLNHNIGNKGGIIGRTKYIRQFRQTLPHGVYVPSLSNLSNQAWLGWSIGSTESNQIILWKKGLYTTVA